MSETTNTSGTAVSILPFRGHGTPNDLRMRPIGALWDDHLPLPECILGTWLHQRHLSMVYAPAGCGKSLFAMSLAIAIAGGGSLFGWKAEKPRRVLLVDGEMDQIDLKTRSLDLLAAVPDADRELVGRNLMLLAYHDQLPGTRFPDLAGDYDRHVVLSFAETAEAELVILDNFSTLATIDDENAASSFDPFLDLMRQLKLAGRAAMLVHHARKNSKGESAYRGTSKMAVIFNTIIRLEHPDGVRPRGQAAFDLTFEKFRGLADDSTAPLRARLLPGKPWAIEASPQSQMEQLVALVRTVDYGNQTDLAKALGVDQATISRLRRKAIASGMINANDWAACLRMAKDGDTDGDDNPDF